MVNTVKSRILSQIEMALLFFLFFLKMFDCKKNKAALKKMESQKPNPKCNFFPLTQTPISKCALEQNGIINIYIYTTTLDYKK